LDSLSKDSLTQLAKTLISKQELKNVLLGGLEIEV
jgi:dethiobiotin synthetase